MKFSVCIPAYNGARLIGETLTSILTQSFQDFEIIVSDDCSDDDTVAVASRIGDPRIRCFQNRTNLGYGKNLEVCCSHAQGSVLFLMGQDDILLKDALWKANEAFSRGDEIGLVTRPYYWFHDDVNVPVRAVLPFDKDRDCVLSPLDGKVSLHALFRSAGQLSGLAYRRRYLDAPFHEEIFPAHIYPFASILKRYKAVYLKDFTVAVRIQSSMTRHNSRIYDISPTQSWVRMFQTLYADPPYKQVRDQGIDFITGTNYVGLAQLKNYASLRIVVREIALLVRYRPLNLLNPQFWIFSLGAIFIPRRALIWMVDNYKRHLLSRRLNKIHSVSPRPR